MYSGFATRPPMCLRLRPTPAEQYTAIQRLLRPWEVEHLVVWYRRPCSYPMAPNSLAVASWLQEHLEAEVLKYIPDPRFPRQTDYWCSPGATLRRKGGDCEDLAILAVSLLLVGGVDAVVVTGRIWIGDEWAGHAWVEGQDERGFFMIEATSGSFYRYRPQEYRPDLWLGLGVFQAAA